MTPSRLKNRFKAISVLGLCFCLGILASHFVLRLMMPADQPVPSDELESPDKKVESPAREDLQSGSTMLVSVSLPAPPPAQTNAEKPLQASAKGILTNESNRIPESRPVPENAADPLFSEQDAIDTQQDALIDQGLFLLTNARQDVPQIQIQLPADTAHSEQVINTLRACLGVRLGKINEAGEIIVQENTVQPASPFVRLVEGKLSRQEQQLAEEWQSATGTMVRFYPESADARVLGGLLQLVKGPLVYKKISGEYRIENGELNLVNIKINGSESQTRLRLSRQC